MRKDKSLKPSTQTERGVNMAAVYLFTAIVLIYILGAVAG